VAAVMAALGPGRFSVDAIRGRQRSGLVWGLLASVIGVAASTALLAATYRPDVKPDDETDA
jgi:putative oxidoreductase